MSDIKPRLRDENDDLDLFNDSVDNDDRPSIRPSEPDLGGGAGGSLQSDLLQSPDSGLNLDETEAKVSGDDPEFNPDAIGNEGEDGEEPDYGLDYQLEERPDLSFDSREEDDPELDYAGPDEEISIDSDDDAVVPELSSSEPRDEIVFGDLWEDDEPVPSVSYPEQEEPVVAEESPATPVEESEPEDEPESDPLVPEPRPPEEDETDAGFSGPEFRAFDEPLHDLDLAVVEPEYEFTFDLSDDGEEDDAGE